MAASEAETSSSSKEAFIDAPTRLLPATTREDGRIVGGKTCYVVAAGGENESLCMHTRVTGRHTTHLISVQRKDSRAKTINHYFSPDGFDYETVALSMMSRAVHVLPL